MPAAREPINERSQTAYRVAVRTAAVAGVFCLVVVSLLLFAYSRRQWKDPSEAPLMKELRGLLAQQPGDAALKEQVRALDLELRQEYMAERAFAARGAVLLLGGIAVLLVAAASAATLRRKLPQPQPREPGYDPELQWKPAARWAVAALGVVLALAAGLLAVRFRPPAAAAAAAALAAPPAEEEIARAWPRFRGPAGSGISAYQNVPDSWDGRSGKNILWKSPVPLPGNNSPVVWGNRVFLSGADQTHREIYCFDTSDGKLLWQKQLPESTESGKPLKVEDYVGYASPTMATDGRLALAIFANGDAGAFDFDGKLVWSRSLGVPKNTYGHAASLATFRNLLLVPMDQGDEDAPKSRTLALDLTTGNTVWQQPRKTPNSWSSPIVIRAAGRDQLITTSNPWVVAYELPGGAELWRAKCLTGEIGPSPVFANGLVYAPSSETGPVCAIAPDGRGDVSKTKVLWECREGVPELCSPLATDRYLFLLPSYGPLTCYDAKEGTKLWQDDLNDKFQGGKLSFKSSPAWAGNRLYLISEAGKAVILEADAKGCKRVGQADLGEPCATSPAFQDGRIYLRGQKNLFCIGRK